MNPPDARDLMIVDLTNEAVELRAERAALYELLHAALDVTHRLDATVRRQSLTIVRLHEALRQQAPERSEAA